MKKFFHTTLSIALIFTACSTSPTVDTETSTSDSDTPRTLTYKTSDFTIEVPDTWDTINSFTDDYPENIRIAFKNDIKDATFTANVTVLREENERQLTSGDYAQEKLQNHHDHLLNYELLSQEELTLTVSGTDSKTFLNTFSGKNTSSGPTLEFMQTVLCKADRAWIVTATYRPDEEEFTIEQMEDMLNSFTVR